MKRKRKISNKFKKRKRVKYIDINLEEPEYHFKKDEIPTKGKDKFTVPDSLSNNKRFKIHYRIIKNIKHIKNILYVGRVQGYINTYTYKKKVKELGHISGMCQISILNPIKEYKGLHLLIKVSEDKKPLTELKCLSNLKRNGYAVGICNSSKNGIKIIRCYMDGKHKRMNKIAFEGNVKVDNIIIYKSLHNPIIKLSKNRYKEYKCHTDTPNKIRNINKEIIIDSQPQGYISKYYNWLSTLLGYIPGTCDMLLWIPIGKYNGFACEFKYGKNGLQKNQKEFIELLKSCGWYVSIVYNSMEMIDKLNLYLNPLFHYKL